MTLTTRQLSESGNHVTFRDHGAGSPVVLLHGVGMQSIAWEPQIASLSQTCRVIAVDMPGHGGSAPLPKGSQLPDFVAWLHDVVQTLDLGPVAVAGHSMGALIALGFAVDHPDLTSHVALLNGVHRRDAAASEAVIARAADITAGRFDLETPLARWFGDQPSEAAARARVAEWLGSVDQDGYATAYAAFARGDATYADRMATIKCHLLAITGDGDPNSTPEMANAMADAVENGRAVVIKGHRHMVNLTAPEAVTAHLLGWLDHSQPNLQRKLQ
ncbi:alpha/beta fold hydrolase [Ruegeria sp. EL01]|jgi:pimeloyl-ACP methyl ester carboxylesterase|uniref:alpha/beta fold hydrolase n=1 Tax=Ruegeria sp. EL01 TaxID=2107578 RepID=UPI000EA82AF5|nr:alpha/beta hydrolase [Ruegeria sp. EL01]